MAENKKEVIEIFLNENDFKNLEEIEVGKEYCFIYGKNKTKNTDKYEDIKTLDDLIKIKLEETYKNKIVDIGKIEKKKKLDDATFEVLVANAIKDEDDSNDKCCFRFMSEIYYIESRIKEFLKEQFPNIEEEYLSKILKEGFQTSKIPEIFYTECLNKILTDEGLYVSPSDMEENKEYPFMFNRDAKALHFIEEPEKYKGDKKNIIEDQEKLLLKEWKKIQTDIKEKLSTYGTLYIKPSVKIVFGKERINVDTNMSVENRIDTIKAISLCEYDEKNGNTNGKYIKDIDELQNFQCKSIEKLYENAELSKEFVGSIKMSDKIEKILTQEFDNLFNGQEYNRQYANYGLEFRKVVKKRVDGESVYIDTDDGYYKLTYKYSVNETTQFPIYPPFVCGLLLLVAKNGHNVELNTK